VGVAGIGVLVATPDDEVGALVGFEEDVNVIYGSPAWVEFEEDVNGIYGSPIAIKSKSSV
jgi:hypothetical protein